MDASNGPAREVLAERPSGSVVPTVTHGSDRAPLGFMDWRFEMDWIRDFGRDEQGEDLIEYGLLAAFVAGVALLVLTNAGLRNAISEAFQKAISTLGII